MAPISPGGSGRRGGAVAPLDVATNSPPPTHCRYLPSCHALIGGMA
jgi:hypothetical protein